VDTGYISAEFQYYEKHIPALGGDARTASNFKQTSRLSVWQTIHRSLCCSIRSN
jgi:hypothetical protein